MGIENRTGPYELGPEPDLDDILRVRFRSERLAIRTATLGTVTSYNAATQEANVRVDILGVRKMVQSSGGVDPNETNSVAPCAPVQLTNVPVVFPGAGDGESFVSFPVAVGCSGVLLVLDRSKDTWMNRTAPVAVDPVKSSVHSLADCVFVPGLTDRQHRITPSAGTTLGIVIESGSIHVGKEATDATSIAIAERVNDGVVAVLNSAINTLAPQGVPVTGTQVAAALTTALAVWQGLASTLGSSKAKVAP